MAVQVVGGPAARRRRVSLPSPHPRPGLAGERGAPPQGRRPPERARTGPSGAPVTGAHVCVALRGLSTVNTFSKHSREVHTREPGRLWPGRSPERLSPPRRGRPGRTASA